MERGVVLDFTDRQIAVDVNYRLFCGETTTSHSDIARFDEESPSHGIGAHDMKVEDLLLSGTVTIRCTLNIIKMTVQKPEDEVPLFALSRRTSKGMDHEEVLFETATPVLEAMSHHKVEWMVTPWLMDQFLRCSVGKKYEGDIEEDLFCLQCWPNGQDEDSRGQTVL